MLAGTQGKKSPGWIQSGSADLYAARWVAANNLKIQKQAKRIIIGLQFEGLNDGGVVLDTDRV